MAATLLSVFGSLALCLAALGLYGVMAYSVSQRTRELGIRISVGAKQRDVLRLILGQTLTLAAIGMAGGFGDSNRRDALRGQLVVRNQPG